MLAYDAPTPEPRRLLTDPILLEHDDPGGRPAGRSTNAYVLLSRDRSLVVDAAFGYLLPAIRQIASEGYPPAGLLLSHRHLAGNGDLFRAFGREFGVPVFLHPVEAGHPQARSAGVDFGNPTKSATLADEFGLRVVLFPGHTEGGAMFYRERDGLILAGDSAMGTTKPQAAEGIEHLIRPPVGTSADDEQLRRNWLGFGLSVSHVGPYHGNAYVGRGDGLEEIMRPLTREEPSRGMDA